MTDDLTRTARPSRYDVTGARVLRPASPPLPMFLDRPTVDLVQTSWREIAPRTARLGAAFYDALFTADPALVALFGANARGAMLEQGGKLMQTLGAAVAALDDPEAAGQSLRALGRRHAAYGVAEAHYETVGAALLQTLARGLGRRFTPDVEAAWTALYRAVAEAMIAGAREGKAAAR